METAFPLFAIGLAVGVLTLVGVALVVRVAFHRVAPDEALVISRPNGEAIVSFGGRIVLPVVQRAEVVGLAPAPLELARLGSSGMVCGDGVRIDVRLGAQIRIDRTRDAVLAVASTIGCARANTPETLANLYGARVLEVTQKTFGDLAVEEVFGDPDAVHARVAEAIASTLEHRVLDGLVLRYALTPRDAIDPHDLLDEPGVTKLDRLDRDGALPDAWRREVVVGPSLAGSRRGSLEARAAPPDGSLPATTDPSAVLPPAVRRERWNARVAADGETATLTLDIDPPRLALVMDGAPMASLRLDRAFRVRLGQAPDEAGQVVLELEQTRGGQPVRLVLRAALPEVAEALAPLTPALGDDVEAVLRTLPRLSNRGASASGSDLVALLGSVRWAADARDIAHWF